MKTILEEALLTLHADIAHSDSEDTDERGPTRWLSGQGNRSIASTYHSWVVFRDLSYPCIETDLL